MDEYKNPIRFASIPLKIVSIYISAGLLWILFSSRFLTLLTNDLSILSSFEIIKGFLFVICTGVLLYWLLSRYISQIRQSEEKLLSLNRLHAFVTETNQLIVRADSPEHLLAGICKLAVEVGGFRTAWISVVDGDKGLIPVAHYGNDAPPSGPHTISGELTAASDHGYAAELVCKTSSDRNGIPFPMTPPGAENISPAIIPIMKHGEVAFVFTIAWDTESRVLNASMVSLLQKTGRDITFYLEAHAQEELRNQAEERLRQNEGLLKAVLDSLPVGVWIADPDGTIVIGNPEGKRIWGGAKYVGPDAFGEYKGWWADTGKPINPEEWGMNRAIKKGETSTNEMIVIEAFDGVKRTVIHSSFPIWDNQGKIAKAVAVNQDITRLKEAENEVRESEKKYRHLFQNSPQPMWVYDLETLAFLMVNDAAVHHYGYSLHEFLGMTIKDIRPAEDVPALLENVAKVTGGIDDAGIWHHVKKDGTVISVEVTSHTLVFNGRKAELVLTNDVTERVKAEEQLRIFTEQLEQRVHDRTQALEEANKELEAFSFSVSHDLRAPLVIIEGYCNALMEDHGQQLSEQGRNYIERLQLASQRMSQMIEALLNLSRYTRSQLQCEMVNVTDIALEVAADLKKLEGNRDVVFRIADDLIVYADPKLVSIVISNLLSNAWKYTSRKQSALIEFGKKSEGEENIFYIRDNGAGYDMAYAEKLFSPFHRLHRQEDFAGTGIGLATVQRIIHRHGGRIWAEGEVNAGATFYFTLGKG